MLEVTLGGLEVVLHDAATVALTGAPCTGPLGAGQAVTLRRRSAASGSDAPPWGLRSYLAVRGGLDVPTSRSARGRPTRSAGSGRRRCAAGDRLRVGDADRRPGVRRGRTDPPAAGSAARRARTARGLVRRGALRLLTGDGVDGARRVRPRRHCAWTVRRCRGATANCPANRCCPGALQVPPDGRPILFGPDAPTTGGYPVLAVVRDADLDHAAQLRPGDTVRFTG